MSTYGALKADVANWLARDDLSAVIPSFIRLAEDDIADDVRVQDMMRRQRAVGNDTRYLDLPLRYLDMRRLSLWPDSDRYESLIQVTPESLQVLNMRDTSTSSYNRPQRYSIHREIEFDSPLGTDAEVEMVFYQRYPALSLDTDTNWLLANAYGLYLYGSLMHAAPYLRNDERAVTWVTAYRAVVASTMRTDQKGRVNQAEARVALSGSTP